MSLPNYEVEKSDIIWFGENHGIKENYLAYCAIIPHLAERGFTNIAWEMPEDSTIAYDDGRFSSDQRKFRLWLEKQLASRKINSIGYIDSRTHVNSQQENEDNIAANVLDRVKKGKTVVISGSFHSQTRQEVVDKKKVIPAAGLVQRAGFTIFTIGLSYAGGSAYNFGVYSIHPNFTCYDKQNNPFGTWLKNTNPSVDVDYWFCVGQAHAITPTQDLDKPTIK